MLTILCLIYARNISVQASEEMQTFFQVNYAGLWLKVDATNEAVPGENITIDVSLNCTAEGVHINYLNVSVYGFKMGGQEKAALQTIYLLMNSSTPFNQTTENTTIVFVPNDVYGSIYCDLHLDYAVFDQAMGQTPTFTITSVRNVYYEQLKQDFETLNASHQQLLDDYNQLNDTYWQLNSTYQQLNETYWGLQQNFSDLQATTTALDNTRSAAVVLGITTGVFAITTIYLVFRKPKEPW
jgi:hypothetical protein